MDETKTVTVPRWALEFIMQNASFWDEGPAGEGWSSPEMARATEALEVALRDDGQGALK